MSSSWNPFQLLMQVILGCNQGLKQRVISSLIARNSIFQQFTLNFSKFARYDAISEILIALAPYFF
jgi:hypothetical protein